jgi:galactonate dehydratase
MEIMRSIRWRQLQVSARTTWTFVQVETSAGRLGTGEATVPCRHDDVISCILRLREALEGTPVRVAADKLRPLPASAALAETAASCAIDQALFDLEGQQRGEPISGVLGARLRSSLEVYANVNRRTVDRSPGGFAASARAAVASGMRAVKIAPFDRVRPHLSPEEAHPYLTKAFDRIGAVRAAIGPEVRLMVDCHWRLSPPMVEEFVAVAAEHSLFWIETPIAEDPRNHAAIRRARTLANAAGVRLAGGELQVGTAGFAPLIDGDLYDVVMPDMTFVGGYAAFLQVAEAAASRGVLVSPHNPTGPVCHAHSVQASAVLPGFLQLETQFDESPLFDAIVDGSLPAARMGRMTVPSDPGLGLRLRSEAFSLEPAADGGP